MSHPFDWTTEKSEYLVNDRWLKLRADSCRMPDGKVVEPYYVLEYPDWVNVVAFTPKQDVILVRQYRHGIGSTTLELPSGCMDANDSSPFDTVKRELLEETGYSSDNFIYTGKVPANPQNHSNFCHCFMAENAYFVREPEPDETEELETVIMPLNKMFELIEIGEFQSYHTASVYFMLKKLGKITF
jgi:8-oxo-dGTP pyrophosphatase MutT (NUDIX family)